MARSLRPTVPGGGGVLRTLERSGLRKGMGGSKSWFYVGTGLWTLRTLRRLAARNDELLISEELKPGQRIVIANGVATVETVGAPQATSRPTRRRARRKQAKADAKATRKAERKAAKRI